MSNTPNLADVLLSALEVHDGKHYYALPGRVESYDSSTQQASVQPLIRKARIDESGERQVDRLPVVNGVPVVFPGCGGFSITWPLSAGDTVLLVFASGSLDKWLSVGGEVDPNDDRRQHISDAIAIPGLRPGNAPVSGNSDSHMVIQTEGEIHAGGSDKLALRSELNDLRAYVATQFSGAGHAHHVSGSATDATTPIGVPPTSYPGTQVLKGS